MDKILINTKDPKQPYVEAIRYVLEQLQKYSFYTNLKNYQFQKYETQFLGFVILAQSIKIEEKKIKTIKNWPKPQSVKDFWLFLGFANFYKRFINNFGKIAIPLILLLQITNDKALST